MLNVPKVYISLELEKKQRNISMVKSILISIKQQYVAQILNGEKTIEVRKKFPKDYVGWVYIYCTKDQGRNGETQIVRNIKTKKYCLWKDLESYNANDIRSGYNGLVLARFWCDKVEHFEFETISRDIDGYWWDNGKMVEHSFITKQCCLTTDEFRNYIEYGGGYAIHISKLEVFDEPKELKQKVPQSWCYIEGE